MKIKKRRIKMSDLNIKEGRLFKNKEILDNLKQLIDRDYNDVTFHNYASDDDYVLDDDYPLDDDYAF
jgi:hypothetical protein